MLPSGLPEHIEDNADLARFLTQSSHFTTLLVKPAAFMPSSKSAETSISRHGPAPLERLWQLGQTATGERPLYGAAIFKAAAARSVTLQVVADEPPPRHAVIRGWPSSPADPGLHKARCKELAAVLASAAGAPLLRQVD